MLDGFDGFLEGCANCDHRCCKFDQGNYIVLLPWEVEMQEREPHRFAHLITVGEGENGCRRVVCVAKDKPNCDMGYKPLDCKFYPVWPRSPETVGRGLKCPLPENVVRAHAQRVLNIIPPEWLDVTGSVELIGYADMDVAPR